MGQVKTSGGVSKIDAFLWGIVVLLMILGFVANYYFVQQPLPLRIVGWLILIGILLALALRTSRGQKTWKFFRESRNELRKVTWPSRQETLQTTAIVVLIVILFAIFMWGVDTFLMWAISWLTGQRG